MKKIILSIFLTFSLIACQKENDTEETTQEFKELDINTTKVTYKHVGVLKPFSVIHNLPKEYDFYSEKDKAWLGLVEIKISGGKGYSIGFDLNDIGQSMSSEPIDVNEYRRNREARDKESKPYTNLSVIKEIENSNEKILLFKIAYGEHLLTIDDDGDIIIRFVGGFYDNFYNILYSYKIFSYNKQKYDPSTHGTPTIEVTIHTPNGKQSVINEDIYIINPR